MWRIKEHRSIEKTCRGLPMAVIKKYEVWKEKNMYGRKYMGVERTTFIINSDGTIGKIFRKVKVADHNKEVLDALKNS